MTRDHHRRSVNHARGAGRSVAPVCDGEIRRKPDRRIAADAAQAIRRPSFRKMAMPACNGGRFKIGMGGRNALEPALNAVPCRRGEARPVDGPAVDRGPSDCLMGFAHWKREPVTFVLDGSPSSWVQARHQLETVLRTLVTTRSGQTQRGSRPTLQVWLSERRGEGKGRWKEVVVGRRVALPRKGKDHQRRPRCFTYPIDRSLQTSLRWTRNCKGGVRSATGRFPDLQKIARVGERPHSRSFSDASDRPTGRTRGPVPVGTGHADPHSGTGDQGGHGINARVGNSTALTPRKLRAAS